MVQLSNHAHSVMTAEQMAVMNVETKALSAWSAKIGTMRVLVAAKSWLLRDNAVLGALELPCT